MVGEIRQLYLLRHAEAASAPGADDAERPLRTRGERDAAAVGRWLHDAAASPGLVLCSPARRARETWELAAAELGVAPLVSYEPRIYGADEAALLELLRSGDDELGSVVLVGHNPAIHALAADLTGDSDVQRGFPAAAVAVVRVSGRWRELAADSAALESFRPSSSVP